MWVVVALAVLGTILSLFALLAWVMLQGATDYYSDSEELVVSLSPGEKACGFLWVETVLLWGTVFLWWRFGSWVDRVFLLAWSFPISYFAGIRLSTVLVQRIKRAAVAESQDIDAVNTAFEAGDVNRLQEFVGSKSLSVRTIAQHRLDKVRKLDMVPKKKADPPAHQDSLNFPEQ